MSKYADSEFQIFFSGVEPPRYFEIAIENTNAILMSYHYMQRKGKSFLENCKTKRPDLRMLVDSGAHTFIKKEDEYRKKPIEYWETYLQKYTQFVRDNKDIVFAVVELDIDYLVGEEKVNEWRRKYFKPLEEEGIQVIYVWHANRGENGWEQMCKDNDYVGFSVQGDSDMSVDKCSKLVNIAKKYGTKVHGFAVTGMDYMQKMPLFTCDSTTWLVGTQFGEINFFDGRTMKRLKKDKWKRQYKNKYIALGANWNLAEREDPYELVRMNILVFLQVEKYIRSLMKNKMYWRQGHKVVDEPPRLEMPKRDIIDFADVPLPDREWIKGEDNEGYEEYCTAWGIDINLEKDQAVAWIEMFYMFLTWDTELMDLTSDEELYTAVDIFGLKNECNTRKKSIESLGQCFKDHACGKRHEFEDYAKKLAQEGQAPPKAKEREEYIEEETHTLVEVPKEQVQSILSRFIPQDTSADMPEVSAIDEELARNNIVPVRDEKGQLLKGNTLVRNRKKIYSDLMPKLSCDTCIKAGGCPDYSPGFVCAYNSLFKRFDTRNKADVYDAITTMVEANLERLQRQMIFEMLDGGVADPTVTAMIEQNIKLLSLINNMEQQGNRITAQRKTVMDSTGKVETVETVTSNPQEGGILSRIFGGTMGQPPMQTFKDDDIIDVETVKE